MLNTPYLAFLVEFVRFALSRAIKSTHMFLPHDNAL